MSEKKFHKNLILLRNKINFSSEIENQKIDYILKWLKQKNLKNKMNVKKIKVNKLKDWKEDHHGSIYHKSKQFFRIDAIKIHSAIGREVSTWDQPILTQKHGGILAILLREKENGIIEFLLLARREAGDNHIKLCPSFSATQSNINLAHGGRKTMLTNLILNQKKLNIIAKTTHYEEGARFWKKPNQNFLIKINKKDELKINNSNFIWLNYSQIKKLNLIKGVLNPFVKTILFMI